MISRRRFLGSAAAAGAVPLLASAQAPETLERVSHGLVLSGGGARGSYQAGIIGALAQANGTTDGAPLGPYGFLCGTSIGALNGWMVATGQYSHLQTLWATIGSANVLQFKPEFAAIQNPTSGVGTRIYQAVHLVSGLRTNVKGVFQTKPIIDWIAANVDLRMPVLLPFIWTSTNLTAQRTEYFYRSPRTVSSDRQQLLLDVFKRTIGPFAVFRDVPDEYLLPSLFASAALPLAFDPVELPSADGTQMHQYVDGGVAANTPVLLARTAAREVDVILLDPAYEPQPYDNALEIMLGAFGTMQRRLLESDIRATFLETIRKHEFSQIVSSQSSPVSADVRNFEETNLAYIRPAETLPVSVGGFNDGAKIQETITLGEQDGRAGFKPYTVNDFLAGTPPS